MSQLAPKVSSRTVILARWVLRGLSVAVLLGLVVPTLLRWQVLTELTGSMAPVLLPGDLVVVRPVSPLDVRPGDVVTFPDPEDRRRLITHRVAASKTTGADVAFVTRGDANNGGERWTVARSGRIGLAVYRLPKLGRLLSYTRMPLERIGLVVLPTLVLGALEIARIWRREETPGPDGAALGGLNGVLAGGGTAPTEAAGQWG